jgi:DNA-binding SARP family transcriptional activator
MAEQSDAPLLKIRLFGAFQAEHNGTPLRGLHLREGERLLAYLVLKGGEPISARDLARLFWPAEAQMVPAGQEDFPSVRQALYSLRQALDTEAFRLTRPQRGVIAFDLTNTKIDVVEFDLLARQEGAGVIGAWETAVGLYRGALLESWKDAWAAGERLRRKRMYEYTLRRLAQHSLVQNDAGVAERWIRTLLQSRPDEEEMGRELIRLLLAEKRHAEAKEALVRLTEAVKAAGREPEAATWEMVIPSATRGGLTLPTVEVPEPQPEFAQLALEPVGGAVPLDSRLYVVRETDAHFYAALSRQDSIVLVKGARQAGKTSLLARGLQQARDAGQRVIATDFQQFNEAQFATLDTLFQALANSIALQLDLEVLPREVWEPGYGPNMNLEMYLRRQVLRTIPEPVVWGMDEVDRLFSYPYGSEVFGLFRSWHNARSLQPSGPWSRLTLAISYATEAHLFITDLNQFHAGGNGASEPDLRRTAERRGSSTSSGACRRAALSGAAKPVRDGAGRITYGAGERRGARWRPVRRSSAATVHCVRTGARVSGSDSPIIDRLIIPFSRNLLPTADGGDTGGRLIAGGALPLPTLCRRLRPPFSLTPPPELPDSPPSCYSLLLPVACFAEFVTLP